MTTSKKRVTIKIDERLHRKLLRMRKRTRIPISGLITLAVDVLPATIRVEHHKSPRRKRGSR